MRDILENLVRRNSVFGNEGELGGYLKSVLEERGFEVETVEVAPGRFNVLGRRSGNNGRSIGFYGHMDTVPVQGNWSTDPFTLKEDGDRLIGLGAYDMKAGIAAILHAVEEQGDSEIRVAFGVDEENNSAGAYSILESGFFRGCDLVMVPEINDSGIEGNGVMLLGRRGRSVYDILVRGRSCHAAHGDGVNAINEASKVVMHLDSMPSTEDDILGKSSQFVSMIEAKAQSLSFPDECRLVLDRHLVGDETTDSVLELLRREIGSINLDGEVEINVRPREMPYLEPYSVGREHPAVEKTVSIVSEIYDEIRYSAGKSVADECVLAKDAPVIGLGPAGGNPHKEDEWVSRRSLEQLGKAYAKIIASW